MSRLQSLDVSLAYGDTPIVQNLSLDIPEGQITTIIGPNGCGKSTLLRALSRLMKPAMGGTVLLDGQNIHQLPTREVAKRLGLLAQQSTPPGGITVEDLVRRGRYPHQSFLQPPSRKDQEAVDRAIALSGIEDLRTAAVDQLSGGQRQRAWIAMALAQETPLLLLDEPTTYLDIAHQLEVMDLVKRLNRDEGRTIVMVLHDINEAARVSDRIVAMRDGKILREGTPAQVLEPELLRTLYGIPCDIHTDPETGQPFALPRSRHTFAPEPVGPACECAFAINGLCTGYGAACRISDGLDLMIPAGRITAIIGPNACGKSTLLRTCGRLLKNLGGEVLLDGKAVHKGSHRAFARKLAMLTQGPVPPSGYLVEDLVSAGRMPHQGLFQQWRQTDEVAIECALAQCQLFEFRHREIDTLSGGQRQRAWMAMALAQETPVLILDEPTTFLDLAAQVDLLDLAYTLNRTEGRTVVMVLHDLNMAARYADHLIAMRAGTIMATGSPEAVLTEATLREVFEIEATVLRDPVTNAPMVIPERALGENPDGEITPDAPIDELVLDAPPELVVA
jgi:iron complex transport system ATP-binding protein